MFYKSCDNTSRQNRADNSMCDRQINFCLTLSAQLLPHFPFLSLSPTSSLLHLFPLSFSLSRPSFPLTLCCPWFATSELSAASLLRLHFNLRFDSVSASTYCHRPKNRVHTHTHTCIERIRIYVYYLYLYPHPELLLPLLLPSSLPAPLLLL